MTPPHDQEPDTGGLVRPYVITNGREIADGDKFELVTLITAAQDQQQKARLDPEKRSLVELCEGGYLSVAEIAGHMELPVGVIKVLLSDLAESGHILTRAPVPAAQLTDIQVLQEVLDGLQARFG
ncbi:DUF742 domain-containing protein [Streptomyces marincola]|uniref:DUF742 domain-containing protein n=1 Tax=Streptomyces marincola TaxID=2878388 RepID=UPI001CF5A6CB|nr:DUF742 domain-containing protein [Streptomyces marincola]UCM91280.1 DUF742 domain-containing protein [Streptomyces marincola]